MRKTPVSGFPKALFFPGSHAQKSSGVEIGQNVTVQPCVLYGEYENSQSCDTLKINIHKCTRMLNMCVLATWKAK